MGDHRSVTEHGLDTEQLSAGVAVAEDAQTAGVCGDRAADARRVPARQVDPVGPAGDSSCPLQPTDGHAAAGGDLAGHDVHVAERLEAGKAQHDLAGERDGTADEPGIATLQCESDAGVAADGDDAGNLGH